MNHVVEKPVAVPYVQYVDRPIHIPYILPVEVPVAYHVPYLGMSFIDFHFEEKQMSIFINFCNIKKKLVKPPPPPLPKPHFIIKTTKYGKHGHGLFDWKHNHHKQIKHVILKKPTHILPDELIAPASIESIGLLPPPRYNVAYFHISFSNLHKSVFPHKS